MHQESLQRLEKRLGYTFQQPALLRQAMTHRSNSYKNNERLEFLGDAILGFVVSDLLYGRYPDVTEGDLSRLRARLVRGESLAEIARALALGDALLLGAGELKSGGFRRASILADAMEAVIGAIYLDSDFSRCEAWLRQLFESLIDALPPVAQLKDPKTRLQEWLQARKQPLPQYTVLNVEGEGHEQYFTIECRVSEPALCREGSGNSRRKAEQAAAAQLIEQLDSKRK
ncbi:MAG: ribonuclease III [Gammaproteobacteria bacterium]|jgi:ribonuclease III|nr:ribonuclease III [Gammaproteobacteria bacterium]